MERVFAITRQPIDLTDGEESWKELAPGVAHRVIERLEGKDDRPHVIIDVDGRKVGIAEEFFLLTDEEKREEDEKTMLEGLKEKPAPKVQVELFHFPCKACERFWEKEQYIQKEAKKPGPKTCYVCRTSKKTGPKPWTTEPDTPHEMDEKISQALTLLTPISSEEASKKATRTTLSIQGDVYQMAVHLERAFGLSISKITTRALEDKIEEIFRLLPELKPAIEMQQWIERQKTR